MLATVSTVGTRRVKPAVYFRPTAQPISDRPARVRNSEATIDLQRSMAGPSPPMLRKRQGPSSPHPNTKSTKDRRKTGRVVTARSGCLDGECSHFVLAIRQPGWYQLSRRGLYPPTPPDVPV